MRPNRPTQFGNAGMPISVLVEENKMANREIIEAAYLTSDSLAARNKFELREKFLDHGFWIVFAVLIPVVLGSILTRHLSAGFSEFGIVRPPVSPIPKDLHAIQKLGLWLERLGNYSPLQLPFEALESNGNFHQQDPALFQHMAQNIGVEESKLQGLLKDKAFQNKAIFGKLLILTTDLALMAFNGQAKLWFKNVLTAKTSGKQGYSGLFNYATKKYLQKDSDDYEKNKKKRLIISLSLAATSIVGLPLIMWGLLKSPNTGIFKTLKKLIPAFNYSDTIFMSKWTFLWYSTFNYVLAGALSARGKNERREHLTKALTLDFFFVIGDAIVSAAGAALMQKFWKDKLGGVKLLKQGGIFPVVKSLKEMLLEVGRDHHAFKLLEKNYWLGLFATSFLLALSIPIMNNIYTKKKVLREQAEQAAQERAQAQATQTQTFHPLAQRQVVWSTKPVYPMYYAYSNVGNKQPQFPYAPLSSSYSYRPAYSRN